MDCTCGKYKSAPLYSHSGLEPVYTRAGRIFDVWLAKGVWMRVLLADDQPTLRSAVRFLLEQESDVVIVAEATDVASLLARTVEQHPDLLLLDWELPGLHTTGSVRPVINSLYASCPNLHIIVLSGRPEASRHALAAGASAFASKADPPERLLATLRRVKSTNE